MEAFALVIISWAAFVAVCIPFIGTLKAEAPDVYQALGEPTVGRYVWRRAVLMPFSGMILSRSYRHQLANHPRSRAWASWLFFVHWLYIGSLAFFFLSMFNSALTH